MRLLLRKKKQCEQVGTNQRSLGGAKLLLALDGTDCCVGNPVAVVI